MEAHEIPESIQWHEGLLLTPQHFQQMSLRHESLLQYVAGAIAPFGWGVRRFEWDAAALAGGRLRGAGAGGRCPGGGRPPCSSSPPPRARPRGGGRRGGGGAPRRSSAHTTT